MNNVIKMLAQQAVAHPDLGNYDQDLFIKIYSEYLIKECARVANQAENNDSEFRCMYDVVVEHFGITR
jgi:hypothetical protein